MYGDPSTLIDQTRNLLLAYGNPFSRSVAEAKVAAARGGSPFPKKVSGARSFNKAFSQTLETAAARAKEQGLKITGYETVKGDSYWRGAPRQGNRRKVTPTYRVPIYGLSKAQFQKEQAEFTKKFQATADATKADIAKQLKILQGEKSSVSKLMTEYSAMIKKEAEAKKQAAAQQKLSLATARANAARASASGTFQIQPAGTPQRGMGGSQQFRRRTAQFGAASPYTGLSTIQSGTVNP